MEGGRNEGEESGRLIERGRRRQKGGGGVEDRWGDRERERRQGERGEREEGREDGEG